MSKIRKNCFLIIVLITKKKGLVLDAEVEGDFGVEVQVIKTCGTGTKLL